MPLVTALRARPRGRVAVELDGVPWRVVPAEAVLRARLAAGAPLDRPTARLLGRELRRLRAVDVAARALRHADLSARGVDARMHRAAIAPRDRRDAVETLERAGIVDDRRAATVRAEALAARGYGDAAIAADLERRGFQPAAVAAAVGALGPEPDRATNLIEKRGLGPRTARFLAGRGFSLEVVEAAAGPGFAPDL